MLKGSVFNLGAFLARSAPLVHCHPQLEVLPSPVFRWRDRVFQGQYLPSLGTRYVAINTDLEKLTPQMH